MEILEFVMRIYLRKLCVEFSMSYLLGHIREIFHRSYHLPDTMITEVHHQQKHDNPKEYQQASEFLHA